MSKNQMLFMIELIRGYDFTYKATNQVHYKIQRDDLLLELKQNIFYKPFLVKAA